MSRTQTQLEAEITTINAALQDIIAGRRLTRLKLGSGAFQREYQYQEITYDSLLAERNALQTELNSLLSEETPRFRTTSYVPLVVSKFGEL